MDLTFTPTEDVKTFSFNCKYPDGHVATVHCRGACHIDIPESCGRPLLRDYGKFFAAGKLSIPKKERTVPDIKKASDAPPQKETAFEPTHTTSMVPPDHTKGGEEESSEVKETADAVE